MLDQLGVTLEACRDRVQRLVGVGDELATAGQIPFTPRAKKVLELGLREAVSLKHNYIGTEHILLGIVREAEGVAMRILQELGVDEERVRTGVIGLLSGPSGNYEHAVDTFTGSDNMVAAVEQWQREGWEIRSITVQRRRRRAG